MSTNYRLLIMDDFDWGYIHTSHKKTVLGILDAVPFAVVEADIPYMIILDIGRYAPATVLDILQDRNISWDAAYFQQDAAMELVRVPKPGPKEFRNEPRPSRFL